MEFHYKVKDLFWKTMQTIVAKPDTQKGKE